MAFFVFVKRGGFCKTRSNTEDFNPKNFCRAPLVKILTVRRACVELPS